MASKKGKNGAVVKASNCDFVSANVAMGISVSRYDSASNAYAKDFSTCRMMEGG